MTTTKQFDPLNRLTQISSAPSASSAVASRYAYNTANQRTAITNADNTRWDFQSDIQSFTWGMDLSGSLQGPSAPGELANTLHFACNDGNGNIAALVNAATGEESARYDYGPFGEVIRATGPMAEANPIRFSTQYADDVSGDVKYLYRDYTPRMGRWLSRDPIEERGGWNLYEFVGNDCLNDFDLSGLQSAKNGSVIADTKSKIEQCLNDSNRRSLLPLATEFLENWYHGAPKDLFSLSDPWIERIFGTKQGKHARLTLDNKAVAECVKKKLKKGEKQDVIIKFSGRPQEKKENPGVKETFEQPWATVASAANEWDWFLSFHNVYFGAEYTGCCQDTGGTMSFLGDVKYQVFDMYIYPDRNWTALPFSSAPSDADMWQVQEYGGAKAFDIEGFKKTKNRNIQKL